MKTFFPNENEEDIFVDVLSSNFCVIPKSINNRLKLQQSGFTIHGGKFLKKDKIINTISLKARPDTLFRINIPQKRKTNILQELAVLGINKESLFPEYEVYSQTLKNTFIKEIK